MSQPINPNTGIKLVVAQEIRELAKSCDLDCVILFGSRARGSHCPKSDIDLAVSGRNVTRFILDVDDCTSTLLSFDVIDLNKPIMEELLSSIQAGEPFYMKKFDHYCSNLSVLSRAEYEDLNNEFIVDGIINKFNIQFPFDHWEQSATASAVLQKPCRKSVNYFCTILHLNHLSRHSLAILHPPGYYSGEGGAKNRSDDDKKTVLFSLNRANTDCYTL